MKRGYEERLEVRRVLNRTLTGGPEASVGKRGEDGVRETRVVLSWAVDRKKERRVGRECRCEWWPYHYKKKVGKKQQKQKSLNKQKTQAE